MWCSLTDIYLSVLAVNKFQQVIGSQRQKMSTSTSTNDSTSLAVPKLRDNGSNWANDEPRMHKAMGSRGLWRHVEGVAVAPKPYVVADGTPVLADGKTAATEEQLEVKEGKMIKYEKREYLAQHIILLTTSV